MSRLANLLRDAIGVGLPRFSTGANGVAKGLKAPNGNTVLENRPAYKKDNFYKARYNRIDTMDAAVGSSTLAWTRFSGTCVLANSTDFVLSARGLSNALKLTNLSSFERIQKNYPSGIVPSAGTLAIPIYITQMPVDYSPVPPTPPTYRTCDIQVVLSADSGFATTTATSVDMTSAQFLRGGWNFLQLNANDDGTLNTVGTAAWTYGGSAPGTKDTSYTYMRLVISGFQPDNTTTPVVYVGGVFQAVGAGATPCVILNIDDGHVDTIDIAAAALSYGLHVASSTITGTVGIGAQMTWAQHRALDAAGHDVIAHSRTHPNFDTLTPAQLANELLCGQDLIANGLPRVADVIAFPENNTNDVVSAATKAAGFTLARGSKPGWTSIGLGLDSGMAVGSRDLGGHTLAQAKKYLDSAQAYGCLQVIYMHRISTKAITSMTYSAGVVTVTCTGHGYSNGNLAHHRGADQAEYNVAGIVENAAANTYTFKVTGTFSANTATSVTANLRTFSPDFPASGGAAPTDTLAWYYSDYLALFQEVATRRDAGTITPVTYSNLLDRCTINS